MTSTAAPIDLEPTFTVDDDEHQAFRSQADELVEQWRTATVDLRDSEPAVA